MRLAGRLYGGVSAMACQPPLRDLAGKVMKLPGGSSGCRNGPDKDVKGWKEILNTSAGVLQQSGVIGVPTDTIYGIACLAQSSQSISNIYNVKGRNGTKPLAICVGAIEDIYRYCQVNVPDQLLRDLLPGPVTLVMERSEELNKELNPYTSEFRDLWPTLSLVVDGGPIGDLSSPESRLGSTVVDISVPGKFTVVRPGCALIPTVEILKNRYSLSSVS
ncbi:threonylcarbamoyl-AMP synthase isoform X2 [Ranitomeya imitator]|uniref:threonylcarbamoyl-AMP synthase isoform X2 n=1 Tax=Ranitomeya imitator TaxID=111125 RepID=UPI0037E7535E